MLFEQAFAAQGGAALAALHTIHSTGVAETHLEKDPESGVPFAVDEYLLLGNTRRAAREVHGIARIERAPVSLFSDSAAWAWDANTILYLAAQPSATLRGYAPTVIDGQKYDTLDVITDRAHYRVLLDPATHLVARLLQTGAREQMVITPSEWRREGGVQLAHRMDGWTSATGNYSVHFDHVELDGKLPHELFTR